MPRQSAESRAAAAFQAGGAPPEPPKHLSKEAAVVWREIVSSKPVDWFDPGARILLEAYCEAAVHHRAVTRKITTLRRGRSRDNWEDLKAMEKRAALVRRDLATLATKLRLSVQANVDWHSRKLGERGNAGDNPEKTARSTLLGGEAVWGRDSAKPN
jgi:phage terminase small subunit